MSANPISDQIHDLVNQLSDDKQKIVLNFVLDLGASRPQQMSGADLIKLMDELNFAPEDVEQMLRTIEEAHDGVDDPYEVNFDD